MESSLEQSHVLLICSKLVRARLSGVVRLSRARAAVDLAYAAELSAIQRQLSTHVANKMMPYRISRPVYPGGE